MLDFNLIQEEPDRLASMLKRRRVEQIDSYYLKELIENNKQLIGRIQQLQEQRNRQSRESGKLLAAKQDKTVQEGKAQEGKAMEALRRELRKLSDDILHLQAEQKVLETKLQEIADSLPNWLDEDVPDGGEENNIEVRRWGERRQFSFKPLTHWQIGEQMSILDLERGVKLATSRFYVYSGLLARLERALINFMLDLHTTYFGYREVFVPMLVNDTSMYVTGQFPKFRKEYYNLEQDNLSLIPTAEVPLVNLNYDQILSEESLPQAFVAATSCFRREAGAAGRDTRGLIRVHQFQKVELVQFSLPEDSCRIHEEMVNHAEEVLRRLKLPYRTILKAVGDTGITARKSYDLEVWMPGLERWLEISSISNCGDYQARRGKIRCKAKLPRSSTRFIHTLNGSGLAAGRCMIAIMENYQQEDGNFTIPQVLQRYMPQQLPQENDDK